MLAHASCVGWAWEVLPSLLTTGPESRIVENEMKPFPLGHSSQLHPSSNFCYQAQVLSEGFFYSAGFLLCKFVLHALAAYFYTDEGDYQKIGRF